MRLIVCSTYEHVRLLKRDYPNDKVVVEGTNVRGYRFEEIVDETIMPHRHEEWWKMLGTTLV